MSANREFPVCGRPQDWPSDREIYNPSDHKERIAFINAPAARYSPLEYYCSLFRMRVRDFTPKTIIVRPLSYVWCPCRGSVVSAIQVLRAKNHTAIEVAEKK
jgi:hypothetical protein